MKKVKIKKQQNGFSLIELMVSVGLMSFLLVLAAPSYSAWMANMRVKSIAEGINTAILQAKSEAIRRNTPVILELNADSSWQIKVLNTNSVVNQKGAQEFSATTAIEMVPNDSNSITFNGFGFVVPNTDGSSTLTNVNINTTSSFDGIKNLRVNVGAGGSSFVCDPAIADSNNMSYCRGS